MACNQCDGDGIGHCPDCAIPLNEKLDLLDYRLGLIVDILREILQELVNK